MTVIYNSANTDWYTKYCETINYADITYTNVVPYENTNTGYYTSGIIDNETAGCLYGFDSRLVNPSWINPGIKYTVDYQPSYLYNPYNITGTIPTDWFSNNGVTWLTPEESQTFKNAIFLQKLKSNLTIAIKSRADLPNISNPAERMAMETLRECISETEFRKYLRYGFVLVKGQSGDTFQIFRNKSHTKVWRSGEIIEEICVRIHYDQKVPPTDNVIAFLNIIRADEQSFRKLGNVFKMNRAAA